MKIRRKLLILLLAVLSRTIRGLTISGIILAGVVIVVVCIAFYSSCLLCEPLGQLTEAAKN